MGIRVLVACLAILGVVWAAAPGALAQASPETAAQLEALDQQLKSDNRFVRLAALEAALASDNLIMRRMAFDAAFGGDDMEMKAYALRQFFQPEYVYPIELLPDDSKDSTQRANELRDMQLEVEKYDPNTGQILVDLFNSASKARGAVALDELSIVYDRDDCSLTLKVASARYMQGAFLCQDEVPMPMRLRLN